MIPARPHLPRPPQRPRGRIRWSFSLKGYAQVVADRHVPLQRVIIIPANDTDSYRW